jgi:hypothetical protein
MKKPTRKLIVRSETIRALRALDQGDLARAVGGDYETGKVNCPAPAIVATATGG